MVCYWKEQEFGEKQAMLFLKFCLALFGTDSVKLVENLLNLKFCVISQYELKTV